MEIEHDNDTSLRAVRQAYERGRVLRGLVGAVPVVSFGLGVGLLTQRLGTAMTLAMVAAALVTGLLWRGETAGRAVKFGLVAGVLPVAAAIGARQLGHLCTGDVCMSWCTPLCTGAGIISGFVVGRGLARATKPVTFAAAAVPLAATMAAMGCTCLAYGGVIGASAAMVAVVLPWTTLRVRAQKAATPT